MSNNFEITTAVSRFSDLDELWLKYYDGIYLGEPFCSKLRDNLTYSVKALSRAVKFLKKIGKNVYFSTPLGITDRDLPALRKSVSVAIDQGASAIEVYDIGVLRMVRSLHKNIPIVTSSFLQVFNLATIYELQRYGVKRIVPYPELDKEELKDIKKNPALEIELTVHGKVPLGYTELCLIRKKDKDIESCPGLCFSGYSLNCGFGKLRTGGRLTFSASDLCLFKSMSKILKSKFKFFRIETRFEDNKYRAVVGRIYRGYIASIKDKSSFDTESGFKDLAALAPGGFCNGYFFSRPGKSFIAD